MAKQQRYFIGPSLLGDIREVITRVDAIAPKTSGAEQPVRLQDLQRPATALRLGSFTGSWATATWKTVTITGTTQTVEVYNWCNPSVGDDNDSCVSQPVLFGRAGGTNSVVEIPFQSTAVTCHISLGGLDLTTLPNYDGSSIQLLGHDSSECLRWYSVTSCATTAS